MTAEESVSIRSAALADSERVFEWRNDPATRAASLTRDEISWPEHEAWFESTLADPDRVLSMAIDDAGVPFAVCRFDNRPDRSVEVSINLDPAMRGRGVAALVLGAAIDDYLQRSGRRRLTATIRDNNPASIRIFERVGFRRVSSAAGVGSFVREAG